MAVADIFDALTTARCYRKSFSFDEALEIMSKDVQDGKIDGEVFAVLLKLVKEGKIVDGVDNHINVFEHSGE
ncbi:MAG: HD domain-containing phosphohydrolase [Lachnospiraceae bacterium]